MTDHPMVGGLTGFQEAVLVEYHPASTGKNLAVYKILLVFTIFLFWAVSLPGRETLETNLNSANLLTVLNQDRIKYGLPPLREDARLARAAAAKADNILQNNYFAHISPTGLQPWDFIKSQGVRYTAAGENLAINYTNPYELENDFLKSPSHRENLLSPAFSKIGIAVISGSYRGRSAIVTVQMFANPSDVSVAQSPSGLEQVR